MGFPERCVGVSNVQTHATHGIHSPMLRLVEHLDLEQARGLPDIAQ